MNTKVPTFIGKPIDDIKAVNAELYAKYNKNKEAMDAIEIQMSKMDVMSEDKEDVKALNDEIVGDFKKVADNPFEMPYANNFISDTFKNKIVLNKHLNNMLSRKSNLNANLQRLESLRGGTNDVTLDGGGNTKSGSKKGEYYSNETIDLSKKYTEDINRGKTKTDKNGNLINPIRSYNPIRNINVIDKLIDVITKMPINKKQYYLPKGLPANAPEEYHIKQTLETKTEEEIRNLGYQLLNNDAEFQEFVNQKVFFERIKNTERDENGRLKFDENQNLITNYNIDELHNNKQFINYLKGTYENFDSKNKKLIPRDKGIGLIGSDKDAFYKHFNTKEKLEKEYLNYIKEKEIISQVDYLAKALAVKNVSYDEIENKIFTINYKAGIDAKIQNTLVASKSYTKLEQSSLLLNNTLKTNFQSTINTLSNSNLTPIQKNALRNDAHLVIHKQAGNVKGILGKLVNYHNIGGEMAAGIAEAYEKGQFKGIENFIEGGPTIKHIMNVLSTGKGKQGNQLNAQAIGLFVVNSLKNFEGNENEILSNIIAYSQLNSQQDDSSPLINRMQNIADKLGTPSYDISNEEVTTIPISSEDVTKGRMPQHPLAQFFENQERNISNAADYNVVGTNKTFKSYIDEGTFKVASKNTGGGITTKDVNDKNGIRIVPTGRLLTNQKNGYYGVMEYKFVDRLGNAVYRLNDDKTEEKTILLANSSKDAGANDMITIGKHLINDYNDPSTIENGERIIKDVVTGDIKGLALDYGGHQNVSIKLPKNLTNSSEDVTMNKRFIIENNENNGTFKVQEVILDEGTKLPIEKVDKNGRKTTTTIQRGGEFRSVEDFQEYYYNELKSILNGK